MNRWTDSRERKSLISYEPAVGLLLSATKPPSETETLPIRWLCLILALISTPLAAMEALVDSDWLAANKEAKGLFLLDIQAPQQYARVHVIGAVNAPALNWFVDYAILGNRNAKHLRCVDGRMAIADVISDGN